jgi:hypothetical protein
MFNPIGIRVECKYLATFTQQMDQVAPVPTSGIQHPHTRGDVPAQDLIEHVDINLSKLLLDAEHQRAVQPPSITSV